MIINYYGKGYLKVAQGEMVLAFNPVGPKSEIAAPKFGATITLVSFNQPDYNAVELTSFGDRTPIIFNGPGEYEVAGLFIRGIASIGPEGVPNTIYAVSIDEINLVHLGALAKGELPAEAKEAIGEIDILFLPTYGEGLLPPAEASKLAANLEPKVVVPLFFAGPGKDTLKKFLKEEGEEEIKPLDKLVIKKKDLVGKEGEVIVVKSF